MKKNLLASMCALFALALSGAPKQADPEAFAVKGKGIDYTGVYPAHIKTIAVITPASYPEPKNFNAGVALLRAAGLKVKVYPSATLKPEGLAKSSYASIPVELRVKDFEAAWCDMENDLILCARGGIGTQDLVANINWEKLPRRPELYVLGYSDVTMLLSALSAKGYGHPLAGPTLSSHPGLAPAIVPDMKKMLAGEEVKIKLKPVKPGDCSGKVVAGLLSRFVRVVKAGYGLETAGKIIVIESVGAKVPVIRAQLDELLAAGFFKGASAVVFGHITRHSDKPKNVDAVINEFAQKVDIPVYRGFPFGHTAHNLVIDFARPAEIKGNTIIFPACNTQK